MRPLREVGRDRRDLARGPARGRDVAARGLRRPHRRDRRRAAPAVRPAAALEGAARAATGSPTSSCCASRASTTSTSTGGSTRARSRSTSTRARSSSHDGERVAFDGLVIATGATPRRLPNQPNLAGLFTLRTLDDALALRELLDAEPEGRGDRRRVHRRRGRGDVPRPRARRHGARGAAAADGARARARARRGDRRRAPRPRRRPAHRRAGRRRSRATATAGRARAARRRLGRSTADVVVVGVGVVPETDWLEGSGLTLDNGVVCDETCLAAPGHRRRRRRRALAEPAVRRRARCGSSTGRTRPSRVCTRRAGCSGDDAEPFAPVPFVWSDQYDRKIQTVGVVSPADADVHVAHGTLAERQFVALFGRGGRLVGALGFNRPRHRHAVPPDHRRARVVGRRARSSPNA